MRKEYQNETDVFCTQFRITMIPRLAVEYSDNIGTESLWREMTEHFGIKHREFSGSSLEWIAAIPHVHINNSRQRPRTLESTLRR
jgi:hypothetical protein